MKNVTIGLVGIVVISVFLFWILWPRNATPITNYPPREGGIVAFGDSLVYGTGAGEGKDFVSLLAGMIGEPIENLGYPGDTTATGLERLDTVIEKHPRIALVLLGGNDYLRKIPREETFRNLGTIVSRLLEDGTLVVLLGVRGGILRDNFNAGFEELAEQKTIAFVPDVLDGVLGDAKLMSDQIHPNDLGHQKIAEKIYLVLSKVLH